MKEEKKAQEKPAETSSGESAPAEVEKSPEPSNDDKNEEITKSDAIVKDMAAMTVTEGKQPNKEYTEEEKAAIKAEREAKKAAKASKKAVNKSEAKSYDKESPQAAAASQPESSDGKTKEQQKAERKAAFELAQKQKVEAGEAAAGGKEGEKSKAELKAERRAKQEAQRAAKEAAKEAGQKKVPEGKQSKEPKVKVPDEIKADDKKVEKKLNKTLKDQNIASRTKVQRQVGLFSHLHQYERELSVTRNLPIVGSNIHPCIIQLGLQHAEGEIVGSSARCISLLSAIKSLLLDSLQQLTSSSDINKELDNLLKPNIVFLRQCRQLSISMSNAIRYLKREVRQLDEDLSIDDLKTNLEEIIDDFININFTLHPKAISETANKKIRNGDVILTYSHSKLVEKALLDAAEAGKKIKVIVADGRVQSLGRSLADNLVKAGIHTTYLLLTAVSQYCS